GQYVHQRAIGGIADGLLFVGQCSLGGRTAQRATELSANGALIVGCPGVVHAGVDDGQRTCNYGRAKFGVADTLEGGRVPVYSGIRALGGWVSVRDEEQHT